MVPQITGQVDVRVAAGEPIEQEVARAATHRDTAYDALRVPADPNTLLGGGKGLCHDLGEVPQRGRLDAADTAGDDRTDPGVRELEDVIGRRGPEERRVGDRGCPS